MIFFFTAPSGASKVNSDNDSHRIFATPKDSPALPLLIPLTRHFETAVLRDSPRDAQRPCLITSEEVDTKQSQTLKRFNVCFVTKGAKKLDLLLGRTAHLLFLERLERMHMFLDLYSDYLQ
jgi:hypothetical protein